MKRYSAEMFLEILREIVFPNYLTYTCANDAYSDFIYNSVEAINFIAPAKTIRVKLNSKLSLIMKFCQQYKDGINTKMHVQKMILKKKKFHLEEELDKNRNKPKELSKA